MKLNEWKQNELNRLLMEKFNLKEKETPEEEEETLDELHGGCGCLDKHPGMSHKAYLVTLEEEHSEKRDEDSEADK